MAPIDVSRRVHTQESPHKVRMVDWFRKNFWAVATIITVTVVCAIIVKVFKKPGQMSVLESQAMDMSVMVPPKGAVPVGIARVERGHIEGSVTYTGSVQAYLDEDVYPRVTGRVVAMPVYPGDRVARGQLLVQLDPADNSEYLAKLDEAKYAEDAAMHNAGIAKEEFDQRWYELTARKEAEEAARKVVDEVKANLAYWKPEVERQKVLLQAKVVSLEEYQRESSELRAAQAKLEQTEAKLREATNTRLAAQAAFDAMVHHVGHNYAAAKQAKAVARNAAIYEKYTRLVAHDDAVVTKRIISPGVVVNPGMLILKLAHVRQVRVQAQVASEDVEQIRLGSKVYIKAAEQSRNEVVASVTSIFPAADPVTRTLTVEALIDNVFPDAVSVSKQVRTVGQYKFLPGQYVVMRIVTGENEGLIIPASAVIWREGKPQAWKAVSYGPYNGATQYQCPMHPDVTLDKPGKCPKCSMDLVPKQIGGQKIAQLVDVEIGLSSPDKTEIVSGLKEGDEVVFAGYARLQPGMSVVGSQWGRNGPVQLPLASDVSGKRYRKW
ncbi:MAG: efflux RND transporter periplasmic adaptor subunit [Candidatus Melainabacteria bacterium]|nr:efflux RND transporter periplasmic adaptor subunit [Candidatus Melainabacteria bacterium]